MDLRGHKVGGGGGGGGGEITCMKQNFLHLYNINIYQKIPKPFMVPLYCPLSPHKE